MYMCVYAWIFHLDLHLTVFTLDQFLMTVQMTYLHRFGYMENWNSGQRHTTLKRRKTKGKYATVHTQISFLEAMRAIISHVVFQPKCKSPIRRSAFYKMFYPTPDILLALWWWWWWRMGKISGRDRESIDIGTNESELFKAISLNVMEKRLCAASHQTNMFVWSKVIIGD